MTYSPAFDRAVALVLKHEGGLSRNPADRGNWTTGVIGQGELKGTNMGIAAHAYPHEDIPNLTRERAIALYHRDYWQRIRGDELPAALALVTFDMAVNAGVVAAIRLLQRTLRVTVDGQLGPVTLARAAAAAGDPAQARALAIALSRRRILYYAGLDGWQNEAFATAWTQRTLETLLAGVAA